MERFVNKFTDQHVCGAPGVLLLTVLVKTTATSSSKAECCRDYLNHSGQQREVWQLPHALRNPVQDTHGHSEGRF